MKTFRELAESNSEEELRNAKLSYSIMGSTVIKDELKWTWKKRNMLIKDIKKRKKRIAYRAYSLSDRDWESLFEKGYTEIGNINLEKNFVSLTLDRGMTNRFSGTNEQTIRLEIKMKEYTEILDDSVYPEEAEILGHDVKWKVTGLDEDYRDWYIFGEQI
jgi:hypothetical protein